MFILGKAALLLVFFSAPSRVDAITPQGTQPATTIRVETAHPWRPPFGLERVGQPWDVVVQTVLRQAQRYWFAEYREEKETSRRPIEFVGQSPATCRISLQGWPDEVAVIAEPPAGTPTTLVRQKVPVRGFEAEAIARVEPVINPVDLGAILVPSDWLLATDAQRGTIAIAALSPDNTLQDVETSAWFESAPGARTAARLKLTKQQRSTLSLPLPPIPKQGDRDVLHVNIQSGEREVWHKKTSTILVHNAPALPAFGAFETRLRYDAPISVRGRNGTFSTLRYDDAWDPKLRDVVVALPSGSRFVFWRGSSYVPFWAGRSNTGLSYEWAETTPPADGFDDCVEPLMDKELRYGRVRIVEATSARIHVRWSYQSCDFQYKVWGDSAVEDFYFYPDGFGTRVLTIQSEPTGDYELSEFIILTPAATYPLSVLPKNLIDILFVDGQKRELTFPYLPAEQGEKMRSREMPAVYRVRLHKDEPMAAVYFNPQELKLPPVVFAPFYDSGQLVTPCYWGSHWPLARGKTTGSTIDDRVQISPCHNSVMSFARVRPQPLRTARVNALDTLGRSKPMLVQTWAWLIGMTSAGDERLLEWARSYASPPSIEARGARLEAESYVPDRRAIRLVVESRAVTLRIKPRVPCVNPVFELDAARGRLSHLTLAGRPVPPDHYAWDGRTLWLDATVAQETSLELHFDEM